MESIAQILVNGYSSPVKILEIAGEAYLPILLARHVARSQVSLIYPQLTRREALYLTQTNEAVNCSPTRFQEGVWLTLAIASTHSPPLYFKIN